MSDGMLKRVTEVRVGMVLREMCLNGYVQTSPQFPDCVVEGILRRNDGDYAILGRPHAMIVAGTVYMRMESFEISVDRLTALHSRYRTVCLASGNPASVTYGIMPG